MPDWTRAIVLTCTEFEVVWELLGLGETPWQLDPARSGSTAPARRAIVAGALDGLRARGLGTGHEPRADLAELLRLLASPTWSADVAVRSPHLTKAVAACGPARCVLAVRHGPEIALLPMPGESAVAALVELIRPVRPGCGATLRIPAAALDRAAATAPTDPDRFGRELVRLGVPRHDVDAFLATCRHVDVHGQLGASVRTATGTRRGPHVVGFHHGAAGLVRQIERAGVSTLVPTSPAGLLDDLYELRRATNAT
jgi:hypothetical protein